MVDVIDIYAIKKKYGIPSELASCHTGLVNGYYLEGHIPAEDIWRLLKEKPDILGLIVPGMPAGSPGMEVGRIDKYQVLRIDKNGKKRVFAYH